MSNNPGQKLAGKIAVITGGSSGIGLATAKRFVEEGAHVVITGRREKELKEAAAFIKRNVTTVVGDVSRLEDLDRLYAVVKEKHGHIDILFANAGAGTIAPLAVATEAHFDQTFDVNVKGLFFTVQKALPLSCGIAYSWLDSFGGGRELLGSPDLLSIRPKERG